MKPITGFSNIFKGSGTAGKSAGTTPPPVTQGSQNAEQAMTTYLGLANKSLSATQLGLRYLERGQGEANFMERPTGPTGRPPGDNRSAEQIIEGNPVLKNLGNQKDIKREELKKQCGDWTEANRDPKSRADAAYNMSKVLNYIDSNQNRNGEERECAGDGNIEGITSHGDARHGTEAGMLKDFAEKGYESLPQNRQLDKTNDTHVRMDGSNKDNFQWAMGEFGKILNKIPILKTCMAPLFNSLGEGRGLWDTLAKGALGWAQNAVGTALTVIGGPASIARTAAMDTVTIVVEEVYTEVKGKEKDHGGGIFT